jgi:hypothetical protein
MRDHVACSSGQLSEVADGGGEHGIEELDVS